MSDDLPAMIAEVAAAIGKPDDSRAARFARELTRYRVIMGHPDTIAALRASPTLAALEAHAGPIRLAEEPWCQPGELYTGAYAALCADWIDAAMRRYGAKEER